MHKRSDLQVSDKISATREALTEFQSSGPRLSGRAPTSSMRQALIAATATTRKVGLATRIRSAPDYWCHALRLHTHHISSLSGLSSSLSLPDTGNLRVRTESWRQRDSKPLTVHCSWKTPIERPPNLNQIHLSHHGETHNPDTARNPPCHCCRGWIYRLSGPFSSNLFSSPITPWRRRRT